MSWCECPLMGVSWCKCPLVGMSQCKCFLLDANAIEPKISFIFQIEASLEPGTKMLSKLDLFFSKIILFYSSEAWMLSASFLPQNMFYFDLRLLQKLVITVRNLRMGYQLEIKQSSSKRFISTVWLRKECHVFKAFFLETIILWKSDILKDSFLCLWIWQFDRRQDPPW